MSYCNLKTVPNCEGVQETQSTKTEVMAIRSNEVWLDRTRDLTRHSWILKGIQIPYPLYQISLWTFFSKILRQILKRFYNLSVAESPVGSNNNRRFLLNRQKTRIVNNFWSKPNFYMKFSELYEKVHNLPDFCRISHEKVVHSETLYSRTPQ